MIRTTYYASADRPGGDSPWTVYRESYDESAGVSITNWRVATYPTQGMAERAAYYYTVRAARSHARAALTLRERYLSGQRFVTPAVIRINGPAPDGRPGGWWRVLGPDRPLLGSMFDTFADAIAEAHAPGSRTEVRR